MTQQEHPMSQHVASFGIATIASNAAMLLAFLPRLRSSAESFAS
jgi:hypothetical protein